MSGHSSKEYIEQACSGIADKDKRAEVAEELTAHIEDSAERYKQIGYSEEEAYDKAVNQMGSGEEIAETLAKIHSFKPKLSFRSAMTKLMVGLIFCTVSLCVQLLSELVSFIGIIFLVLSALQMRKCSKKFQIAFWLSIVLLLIKTTIGIITKLPISELHSVGFTLFSTKIFIDINPIEVWWIYSLTAYVVFVFRGLSSLLGANKYAKKLNFAIFSYTLLNLWAFTSSSSSKFFGVTIVPLMILITVILPLLNNVRQYIYFTDINTGIRKLTGKAKAVTCVVLSVTFVTVISASYFISIKSPEQSIYTVVQSDSTAKIRKSMIKCGFPKEVLKIMSDDEILKYEGINKVDTQVSYYSHTSKSKYIRIFAYLNEREMRTAFYFFKSAEDNEKYSERMKCEFDNSVRFYGENKADVTMLLLHNEDDKLLNSKPVFQKYNKDKKITAFQYKFYENVDQKIYCAFNLQRIRYSDMHMGYQEVFYRQNIFYSEKFKPEWFEQKISEQNLYHIDRIHSAFYSNAS